MKPKAALILLLLILTACSRPPGAAPAPESPPATDKPAEQPPVSDPAPAKTGDLILACGTASKPSVAAVSTPAAPAGWERSFPQATSRNLTSVTYGNGLFLAVGDEGTAISSPDGERWSVALSGQSVALNGVAFGGGRFVAVGQDGTILSSADGKGWSKRALSGVGELKEIAFGNGRFVTINTTGAVWTSTDGESWSACTGEGPKLSRLSFQNGLFAAFGPGGGKDQPSRRVYTSGDGLQWTAREEVTALDVNPAFVYGNGQFLVVASQNEGAVSSDGVTWRRHTLTYEVGGGYWGYGGAAYGDGQFLLPINACDPGGCVANLLVSTDGAKWTSVGFAADVKSVTFGGDRFVGVGDRGSIVALSGSKVLYKSMAAEMDLTQLAYGGGRFVAMGWLGTLFVSQDGRNWTGPEPNQWGPLITGELQLIHGGSLFVATGVQKHTGWVVYVSADGKQWKATLNVSEQYGNEAAIKRASYKDGQWVVELKDGRAVGSKDGQSWAPVPASAAGPETKPLSVVLPGENVLAAAEGGGHILALTAKSEIWIKK